MSKQYAVKEIFYTLQGEGAQAGRPAVFLRFSGCNLWNGRQEDRATAICTFCDTDFVGTNGVRGGTYSAAALANAVASLWPGGGKPYVVCTGGEPLLQLDTMLIEELHKRHFEIAVETNGTKIAPPGIDWICVSPKAGAPLVQRTGNELKLVFPQAALMPTDLPDLSFTYYFLQPMDGANQAANTQAATHYCMEHPQWRLSLQTHKIIGID
jgi:7-carboxy-7-deazaguanine synthase (Cx14CxxC type)